MRTIFATAFTLMFVAQGLAFAQTGSPQAAPQQTVALKTAPATAAGSEAPANAAAGNMTSAVTAPADFTIGPEDVLDILFWRDKDMSAEVTVRPDGMITLPLVRDIKASGFTPNELADRIQTAARDYVTDASVTVVVKQMNSRKVFITGEVAHPGAYALPSSLTVMQLIAVAGGLTEWADAPNISVMRTEGGLNKTFPFDYKDVARGRKAQQNIALKPGDTVVVPER